MAVPDARRAIQLTNPDRVLAVAERIARGEPESYVTAVTKSKRKGAMRRAVRAA